MLVVVPYLVKHPGTPLADAARLFDADERVLRRDLELLQMAGLPPYLPGDLIEVDIDADDSVWIRMADHFARPLRITRQEAMAVRLRAAELLATPGVPEAPDLASAVAKLDEALGASALVAVGAGDPPRLLDAVRSASADHQRIKIAYVDAGGERSERVVDPESVFADTGHWYVTAWDTGADGERLLRVDRILELEPSGETFPPRGLQGAGRPLYSPGPHDVPVRLRLDPDARWVSEYYATSEVVELGDGVVEATLPAGDLEQIARLLLRLGPGAEVLEPPGLADRVRALARQALARYEA
jgi:proteasome accessory factor C